MECEFCDVAGGDGVPHEVYRDDDVVAFLDRNPAAPGHTLVVPTVHRERLADLGDAAVSAMFHLVRDVSAAQRRAFDADGVSVFQSSGAAAGQDVFHVHAHVVPRHEGDDIRFAPSRQSLVDAGGADVAARIAEEL
jgi:histidine triad (HIT) family protein